MHRLNKLLDKYTSTNDDTISSPVITNENTVCLTISSFIFSFLLSFIIDPYNFIPLTAIASIHGIIIIFCANKLVMLNNIPFAVPKVVIMQDIVYPKEKPLNITIKYTIGIPITVEPINHIIIAVIK